MTRAAVLWTIVDNQLLRWKYGTQVHHRPVPAPLDTQELNSKGTYLLFRDKKRHLHLYDIQAQQRTTLLAYCQYVQWVPGADVVVAQSRQELCVWYNISAADTITKLPIKVPPAASCAPHLVITTHRMNASLVVLTCAHKVWVLTGQVCDAGSCPGLLSFSCCPRVCLLLTNMQTSQTGCGAARVHTSWQTQVCTAPNYYHSGTTNSRGATGRLPCRCSDSR
jgi:hypothetical protein